MSLEIKRIVEADETDPFVPADPAEVDARKSAEQKKWEAQAARSKAAIGAGVEAWRSLGPSGNWPTTGDEGVCPVCGSGDIDLFDNDGDDEYHRCNDCNSEILQVYYTSDPTYDYSEVTEIGSGEVEESVTEAAVSDEDEDEDEVADLRMHEQGYLPVDPVASDLSKVYYETMQALTKHLGELRDKNNVEECKCSYDVLDYFGEQEEFVGIPSEENYADEFCLRCGGWRET